MEMQGDMEKQNRRKEQEYIKGLKRYEQKGIPVYIDGKKPEEEDWEKIFQIQEDGGFYMSDFIGLEDGKLQEIVYTEKDPGPDQSTTFRLRQSDPGLDIQVERPY